MSEISRIAWAFNEVRFCPPLQKGLIAASAWVWLVTIDYDFWTELKTKKLQPWVNLKLAVRTLTTSDQSNPTHLFNSSLAVCLLVTGEILFGLFTNYTHAHTHAHCTHLSHFNPRPLYKTLYNIHTPNPLIQVATNPLLGFIFRLSQLPWLLPRTKLLWKRLAFRKKGV